MSARPSPAAACDRGQPDPGRAPLAAYLRLLWNVAPRLLDPDAAERPFVSALGLHLPPAPVGLGAAAGRRWQLASAAHAAAHLVYSRAVFRRRGLAPIAQALISVLEDARCEALALRELPGLKRLWLPLHRATPDDGDGIDTLLLRLARALLDADYVDPHPWIEKARRLVYVDGAGAVLALRQAADLHRVASRLGHDLGQMRLGFDVRAWRPGPDYRDDNRWLWRADEEPALAVAASLPDIDPQRPPERLDLRPTPTAAVERHYPEWDRRIGRLRPQWCRVLETEVPPAGAGAPALDSHPEAEAVRRTVRVLRAAHVERRSSRRREECGDETDVDALIDACIQRRAGAAVDTRVHRRLQIAQADVATLLLIDVSASSADPFGDTTVLDAARRIAATLAVAMHEAGEALAIQAFSSCGRGDVRLLRVQSFGEPAPAAGLARLAALQGAGSTRLGAALRHATQRLAGCRAARRRILVLTDGEPHDVDIHEPQYLVEDARHAVQAASRQGIEVACLGLGAAGAAVRRRIFGAARCRTAATPEGWVPLLAQILG